MTTEKTTTPVAKFTMPPAEVLRHYGESSNNSLAKRQPKPSNDMSLTAYGGNGLFCCSPEFNKPLFNEGLIESVASPIGPITILTQKGIEAYEFQEGKHREPLSWRAPDWLLSAATAGGWAMTTGKVGPVADDFDGIGWREYMRGIENGNIDPTGVRLRAVCKMARENLEAAERLIATPRRSETKPALYNALRDIISIAKDAHLECRLERIVKRAEEELTK